jgi:hypothetical protein
MKTMDDDLFDSVLNLEDDYYEEGYKQGVEDGTRAGRIEGRVFGLEKGLEKYLAMGQLNGKACVWAARMPSNMDVKPQESQMVPSNEDEELLVKPQRSEEKVPLMKEMELIPLPQNARLEKHITTLYALTEAESLSTQNNEDSVSDFDDRIKRAMSKAKVVQNIIGERNVDLVMTTETQAKGSDSSKDRGMKITRAATDEKNIEDFGVKPPSS